MRRRRARPAMKTSAAFVAEEIADKAAKEAGSVVYRAAKRELDPSRVNYVSLNLDIKRAVRAAVKRAVTPICREYWR